MICWEVHCFDPTTGYASARINAADMTNKGFELQLGVDVLKLRNFNWNVNWIFAHNSNKITNNNINESSPSLESCHWFDGICRGIRA